MSDKPLPRILEEISLEGLNRIDVALEGDWSPTVVTVWTREEGFRSFSEITHSHPKFKPSLELYFEEMWVGVHCFNRVDDRNVFDKELAMKIIEHVEERSIPRRNLEAKDEK